MDYKNVYLNAFNKTMKEIDSEVISQVKILKERNKNFTALVNQIKEELWTKEKNKKTSLFQNFPDLYEKFTNRFNEYDTDHLTSYFNFDFIDLAKNYSQSSLEECAVELGVLESYSRAAVNFSNSDKFLEAIYALNKNYENYTLDFDPNDSPIYSDLFYEMQKERFPGSVEVTGWEEVPIEEVQKKELRKTNIENEVETVENQNKKVKIKPGDPFEKAEKLYILHLLHELINQGSEMTTTEFLRILHLTSDIIDTSAEITGNPPNYRRINDGFFTNESPKKRAEVIEGAISKLHKYEAPMLKQILKDKLKIAIKKKHK